MLAKDINVDLYQLASYASDPRQSRGRLYKEDSCDTRSTFRRDCDRIIHSEAFRRLQYKTQVFVNHEGDHYRTRLTHSLEVAQIARSISRNLSLNEDLAEATALAHDLGHTPFGHAGEEALQEACKDYCRFSHNTQVVKLLTQIEHKYADFDGLNLSWEVIEGIVKHNGPIIGKDRCKERYDGHIPGAIATYDKLHSLELDKFSSAEAQIASFADDIAYNNHDIDDGLRAGLFTLDDVKELPMVGNMFRELHTRYPDLSQSRLIHEANRRMINRMIVDLTRETLKNIKEHNIQTSEDIRSLGKPLVGFSKTMEANVSGIKDFLRHHMYRHYKVSRMTSKARRIVRDLFDVFFNQPECLPTHWAAKLTSDEDTLRAEVVADYIAGMTDRYAVDEHNKLFNMEHQS